MTRRFWLLAVAILAGLATVVAPSAEAQAPGSTVRIGMLQSMFRDITPTKLAGMSAIFNRFVYDQTGLPSELKIVATPDEMRRQLNAGEVQVGAFHGFEYAWMKLQDRELQPLMVVAGPTGNLKTVIVTAKDCPCSSVAEMRGQTISVPTSTREHSRLFLSRRCRSCGHTVKEHFAQEQAPSTVEDALDDVVEGISYAAVVDQASLQTFAKRKPGRYARLKIVEQSDIFPPSVIAYSQGKVGESTLDKFRMGMTNANKTTQGSMMMGVMKIAAFEPVPANFDQILTESVKNFPPPTR